MKKVPLSILLVFLSTILVAQEKLSLSDAISIGLENNYNLRISQKSVEISDENNSLGTAGRYPTIDISVTSINRFDSNDDADITTNNIAPSAQLSWTLFNGFRIFNTKSKLEDQFELSKGFNAVAVENTIQSIVLAYFDVLLQKERLKVFEELESLSKDRYERTEASKEIGGAVTYEVLQAKTAWLEDKAGLLSQKLNYDNSIRALNLLIGEKDDKVYSEFDDFSTEINNYSLDDLMNKMLASNKTLKNQYLNEVISDRDIDIARGGMYPRLSLNAGYDFLNSTRKIAGLPKNTADSYDYYGNLTLSLNLFDGLNTRRSLEIAKIQSEISKIETEEMTHTLTNVLTQLMELYNIQKDLLEVAEENLAAAKLNLQISEEKFKSGAINSFNFRDVQIIYLNASLQRLNSIFNLINTDTELARLTGSIINEN
jgi:outer membrane protein TolC